MGRRKGSLPMAHLKDRILYNNFLGRYVYAIATLSDGRGPMFRTPLIARSWAHSGRPPSKPVIPAPRPLADYLATSGSNDICNAATAAQPIRNTPHAPGQVNRALPHRMPGSCRCRAFCHR